MSCTGVSVEDPTEEDEEEDEEEVEEEDVDKDEDDDDEEEEGDEAKPYPLAVRPFCWRSRISHSAVPPPPSEELELAGGGEQAALPHFATLRSPFVSSL